jgi:hypothetical protein
VPFLFNVTKYTIEYSIIRVLAGNFVSKQKKSMADERYKKGFQDLSDAINKSEPAFDNTILLTETKRLQQIALSSITFPLLALILFFYIDEVAFTRQTLMLSGSLGSGGTLLLLYFLIRARIDQKAFVKNSTSPWIHWRHYLMRRLRGILFLYFGFTLQIAALISITYKDRSILIIALGFCLVALAGIMLVSNFWHQPYKVALRRANRSLQ